MPPPCSSATRGCWNRISSVPSVLDSHLSYLPYPPADLKAIEYGKYGHNQKCERDEVVIESYLPRKNDTAVESIGIVR